MNTMKKRTVTVLTLVLGTVFAAPMLDAPRLQAQQRGSDPEHTLPLTWDRWLDHDEIGERMQLLQRINIPCPALVAGTNVGGPAPWE